ncbi:YraN family protein [Actibacterium pelagium]|uniref:UPF0102 protein GCM10011517_01700 n=1 Tax=Actibacterium pelagium TaxID=2029103 RepID=A0A917AAK9_9RHOB|nr:YraN family protein [Actibacterium pelagium]GGE37626.1 UPF0102 protein [Actibacterium pelagium]
MTGQVSYRAGLAAEAIVAEHYRRRGAVIAADRWRGKGGEIDLVAREGGKVIFIEVKKSKTHAEAATHLSANQIARIFAAASEFLAGEPKGQLTETQFDVALVDGQGKIDLLENALSV